ncbi:hypothetical protein B0H66DRAFT_298726 [Apodospora peruviana]|uniref:Uncharacterized protein n=1 Tax=Apodospora peruviana TaxID=516989 RepID=A0AAE0I161_9PEZI|nr:hypothetical protein B0H66DRAFT_298726 [Apodospora peruviana]
MTKEEEMERKKGRERGLTWILKSLLPGKIFRKYCSSLSACRRYVLTLSCTSGAILSLGLMSDGSRTQAHGQGPLLSWATPAPPSRLEPHSCLHLCISDQVSRREVQANFRQRAGSNCLGKKAVPPISRPPSTTSLVLTGQQQSIVGSRQVHHWTCLAPCCRLSDASRMNSRRGDRLLIRIWRLEGRGSDINRGRIHRCITSSSCSI